MADMTRRAAADARPVCEVLTVGQSTRPIDEFVAMLVGHGAIVLVDVRTVPRSLHNLHFGDQTPRDCLTEEHIGDGRAGVLGSLRRTTPDSPNTGWRNLSFRGYADYMQAAEFTQELIGLIELAPDERIALMCAEALPWRCHRSMIADALIAHGVTACEIANPAKLRPHKLTPSARVVSRASGTWIDYPPEQP